MTAVYGSLPFDEQIAFFREKVSLPTRAWNDLWQGMHARAFVVAGATKAELLADLRGAIDKAIAEGTTLEEFRKDFDGIVEKHGWSYKGGRGWRTRVMLETNIRTSYQAGRFKQMTDPETLRERPFWEYIHRDSVHPRPLHVKWGGTVLRADDPWWRTHYTPNGWGCKCTVAALSHDDLEDLGKRGPDAAPDDGTYTWTDRRSGEVHEVPNGIDPGWAYNVGEAAWGRPMVEQALERRAAEGAGAWERLTPGDWQAAERPARLAPTQLPAIRPTDGSGWERAASERAMLMTGGDQVYRVGAWDVPVLVNGPALAARVEAQDAFYLSLLPVALTKPDEVWLAFERLRETGKVVMRVRAVKAVRVGSESRVAVATAGEGGVLESWEVLAADDLDAINAARVGELVEAL